MSYVGSYAPIDPAHCPLCRSRSHVILIERPKAPVLSNRFYATREAARDAPSGHLRVESCLDCGFAFNSRFDPALARYDIEYENTQTGSPSFSDHFDDIRNRLLGSLKGEEARVLEIGCGQGNMLESLLEQGAGRVREAVGYDTAWRPRPLPPDLVIHADMFDDSALKDTRRFDVVIARHVLEHVVDPVRLLKTMAAATSPLGRVCIETPDLEWIVANGQMQDFFYEHCNYFTADTLAQAFRRAGLGDVDVRTVFRGQYLWAEATVSASMQQGGRAIGLLNIDDSFFARWRSRLIDLRQSRTIAIWGAGAKGVTFATETDPDGELICGLIDVNAGKQGKFIPCSGHPVFGPHEAALRGISIIVVMNPNYQEEILQMASAAGLTADMLACLVDRRNDPAKTKG